MLFHFALNAMQPSVQPLNHGALKELQNSLTVKSVTEKQSLPADTACWYSSNPWKKCCLTAAFYLLCFGPTMSPLASFTAVVRHIPTMYQDE